MEFSVFPLFFWNNIWWLEDTMWVRQSLLPHVGLYLSGQGWVSIFRMIIVAIISADQITPGEQHSHRPGQQGNELSAHEVEFLPIFNIF